jgi:hypothetical protein
MGVFMYIIRSVKYQTGTGMGMRGGAICHSRPISSVVGRTVREKQQQSSTTTGSSKLGSSGANGGSSSPGN